MLSRNQKVFFHFEFLVVLNKALSTLSERKVEFTLILNSAIFA